MNREEKNATANLKSRRKLELPVEHLRERTTALFSELDEDPEARKAFLKNPVGRISAFYGAEPEPQAEASATRVLFSMLANDRFRTWLETYPAERDGKRVDQQQFASDFAQAVLDYGDRDLTDNLFRHAALGYGIPGFGDVFHQFVTGPEKTFVTPAATPSSSSAKVESSQNFEHKGFGFGDMSVVNPAQLRVVMELLIDQAKNLSEAGKLSFKTGSRR